MEHYFKEDQPITSMVNNTTHVAWIDETSLITEHKDDNQGATTTTNPFDYLFG